MNTDFKEKKDTCTSNGHKSCSCDKLYVGLLYCESKLKSTCFNPIFIG